MKRVASSLFRGAIAIAAGSICLGNAVVFAQGTGDAAPRWRFGVFGGASYNYVEAPVQHYVNIASDPSFQSRDYSKASGLAPYGGIGAEYVFDELLGLGLRVAYDDRTVTRGVDGRTFTPRISYITIEPALRLNIYRGLYFNAGPSVSFPIRRVYDYTIDNGETGSSISDAELANVRDVSTGAWGGFGYDIPLNHGADAPRWYITPFVEGSWLYDQKKADVEQSDLDRAWTTLTARAGMQVKAGIIPAPARVTSAPPDGPELSLSLRTPRNGVLQPRDLIEHMPLVNYVFFDKSSTEIPARYARVRPENAASFDERSLAQGITTGSAATTQPEERQMQVYYNVLNIFGERLGRNAGTKIDLVGSAPDQKEGLAMAESVKSYMVNTFGIAPDRITTKGQLRPPHASGTRATPKIDLPLVAEENRRVEILTDDQQLLAPVGLRTQMREPVVNNIDLEVSAPTRLESWSVTIAGEGYTRSYGPFHSATQRINATPILGTSAHGTYKATVIATMENGGTLTKEATFTLGKTDRPAVVANRYSILFEYDESKSVELYEQFLRQTVAPALPKGSLVYVHGHTDMIGEYDYNAELSSRRAETTTRILEEEMHRLGRDVVFEVYGFGEDMDEAPFENGSSEERHYNRTVVIDIFEGL